MKIFFNLFKPDPNKTLIKAIQKELIKSKVTLDDNLAFGVGMMSEKYSREAVEEREDDLNQARRGVNLEKLYKKYKVDQPGKL